MAAAYAEAEAATGGVESSGACFFAPWSTAGAAQQPDGQQQQGTTSSGSSSSSANGTTSNSSTTTLASSFQSLLPSWMRDLITGGASNNTNISSGGYGSSSGVTSCNNDLFSAGNIYPSEELLHKSHDVSALLGDDEQGAQPEPQAPTGGTGTAKNEDEIVFSAAWASSSSSFENKAAKAEVVGGHNVNLVSTSASSASDGDGEQLPLFGKNVNAKTLNCFDSKNGDVLGRAAGAVVKSTTTSVDVEQKWGNNKDAVLGVTAAAAANDESKAVQQDELMQQPATLKMMAKEQKVKQGTKAMKKAATSSTCSVAAGVIDTTSSSSSCLQNLNASGALGAAAGPDEIVSSKGRGAKSKKVKAAAIGTSTKKPAAAIVRKGPEAKDAARKMRYSRKKHHHDHSCTFLQYKNFCHAQKCITVKSYW